MARVLRLLLLLLLVLPALPWLELPLLLTPALLACLPPFARLCLPLPRMP